MDAVAVGFEAVGERDVRSERVGAAQGGLPGGGDVVVAVVVGIVEEEDEEVGVAAIGVAGGGALAELLLDGGEPALGALPGVVGAVELVGSVGAVAGGEERSVVPGRVVSQVSEARAFEE